MKDAQILNLMIASLPTMLTVLVGILINNARLSDNNARLSDLRADMNNRFSDMERRFGDRFDSIEHRFDEMDRRFDDLKELWRSELHRVEQVLDARLKHLEED